MQIENLKRWHWALLGILVGLVFAFVWQDHDVVGDRNYEFAEIKQNKFEQYALSKSRESGRAILQDVRVEPPVRDYMNRMMQIVTGKRLGVDHSGVEKLVNFYYYASDPYKPNPRMFPPGVKPLASDATVMDFLAVAASRNLGPDGKPLLHFRYAWEMENHWSIALFALGGLVVIGGIWPTVLNILIGAGLGRPPKSAEETANEDYLKRFGKDKQAAPAVLAAKGPTAEDHQRLDEMNAALESQLAAAGVFSTGKAADSDDSTAGSVAAGSAIVPLSGGPLESAAPPADNERRAGETEEEFRKRFAAGDFYPVARGAKKQ